MQSDRNVPSRNNPQGQAKNGANLLAVVAPTLESSVKKTLAALAVAAATVAALAVPAGASTTTIWKHLSLHCAGNRSATVTFKMQGGQAVDSWVDNRCGRQYVTVTSCASTDRYATCGATDIGPRTKTHLGPLGYQPQAQLGWSPYCGDGPGTDCQY